jgi:hypothetical protein
MRSLNAACSRPNVIEQNGIERPWESVSAAPAPGDLEATGQWIVDQAGKPVWIEHGDPLYPELCMLAFASLLTNSWVGANGGCS